MTTDLVNINVTPLTQIYSILGTPVSEGSSITVGALLLFLILIYLVARVGEKR